jgi:hypothetical protein
MSPKRIDAADTVDTVTHLLHRLQSEGWAVKSAVLEHGYGTPLGNGEAKHGATLLPTKATVTIELIPARG